MRLEKRKNHTLEAIVDRIILKPYPTEPVSDANAAAAGYDTRRLSAAVASALQLANGLVLIGLQAPNGKIERDAVQLVDGVPGVRDQRGQAGAAQLQLQLDYGACPECHGLGSIYDFDPAKTISDWSKPLLDGAMGPGSSSQYLLRLIKLAAEKYKINLKQPFSALTKDQQQLLLYGPPRNEVGALDFTAS
jgi:excinuclease ABC subunit A